MGKLAVGCYFASEEWNCLCDGTESTDSSVSQTANWVYAQLLNREGTKIFKFKKLNKILVVIYKINEL